MADFQKTLQQRYSETQRTMVSQEINPRCTCAVTVTVLGLSVRADCCQRATVYDAAMRDINNFSVTSA